MNNLDRLDAYADVEYKRFYILLDMHRREREWIGWKYWQQMGLFLSPQIIKKHKL